MSRGTDGPQKRQQLVVNVVVVTREVVAGNPRSDQPVRIAIGVAARRPIGDGCRALNDPVEFLVDSFAINPIVTVWIIWGQKKST